MLLKMIFPVWILKSIKNMFGMEYDQRVIIKFLWNEGTDACDIANRLQTDCRQIADRLQTDSKYYLVNMFIHFERFNSGLQRYGSVVKTSMMKFAPEDFLWMILMPKFWLY
jgi:hypothetical protein